MIRFTKLTTAKAKPIQNYTRKDPLQSSPSLSPPRHTKIVTPSNQLNPLLKTTPTHTFFPSHFFLPSGKRQRKRSFMPNSPPPPIPTLVCSSSASSPIIFSFSSDVSQLSSPFPTSPISFYSHVPHTPASVSSSMPSCRPPPRSNIPADCVFETDDQSSVFSLSLYRDDLDLRTACLFSSELADFRFDVDLEMDVHAEGGADYPLAPFEPQRRLGNGRLQRS